MNMFKSLLLTVVCGSVALVNAAQEPSVSPAADVQVPSKPVVAQGEVQAPKQQVADDKNAAQNVEGDLDEAALREWIESLTEEEKAEFEAAMNEVIESEVPAATEASIPTEMAEAVEPVEVENKVVAPEVAQPAAELPQVAN